jgi:hypothetical protein
MRFRSVTAGTCALHGRHRNADMLRECPLLRAQRRQRHAEGARMRTASSEAPPPPGQPQKSTAFHVPYCVGHARDLCAPVGAA